MTDENDERTTPTGDALRKQYPSNSHRAQQGGPAKKPERERLKPAVHSEVQQKKPGLGKKMKEAFVGDDAQTVGGYILFDVIIPAAKNLITDMVTQGLERALFGDARGRISTGNRYNGGYGSRASTYKNAYQGGISRSDDPHVVSRRPRLDSEVNEYVLSTRGEAEEVLQRMGDQIDSYDAVSLADYKDLLNLPSSQIDHTDNKWGWDDLRTASIRRVSNGYLIDLPRVKPLD